MAVTMSAKITDKGVAVALGRLTGNGGGGGRGNTVAGSAPLSPQNIADIAAKAMTYTYLPRVFDTNEYGWKPTLREGGTPLVKSARQASRIRSAFVYSVAGAVATIRNLYKYAFVHDQGAAGGGFVIKAKNAKMLRFKIGDRWTQKKQVTIPQRRFMYWSDGATRFVMARVNYFIRSLVKGTK